MRELRKPEMSDVSVGAGLLGAGGGGAVSEGLKMVDRVLTFGDHVDLVQVSEVDDDAWGAVIAGMGSPVASRKRPRTYSLTWAMELLAETLGFDPRFVIPFELGAGNSITPMLVGVQMGIPVVDGDPVGRAVPQIDMTTFHLGGVSISPLALVNEDKISAVIRTDDPYDMERVARAVSAELGSVAAIACYAMQGRDMKRLIIQDTTTLVERIGATMRAAREAGDDVATALVERYDGYLLGRGTVTTMRSETRGGFDYATVEVEGELPIRIGVQNENMVAHRGDTLLAVVPDLICAVSGNGMPLSNAEIEEGQEISYVGFEADPAFRTAEAFALFSTALAALDYDGGFVPIEDLQS
jgi:DUF917 family protein